MKIGIVGSRRRNTWEDFLKVYSKFCSIYDEGDKIVSGGCSKGGDKFAEIIACNGINFKYEESFIKLACSIPTSLFKTELVKIEEVEIPIIIHYPEEVPKGSNYWAYVNANYSRNTLIANDSDVLIACVASDRKGGTEDTIKKFLKRGNKNLCLV